MFFLEKENLIKIYSIFKLTFYETPETIIIKNINYINQYIFGTRKQYEFSGTKLINSVTKHLLYTFIYHYILYYDFYVAYCWF